MRYRNTLVFGTIFLLGLVLSPSALGQHDAKEMCLNALFPEKTVSELNATEEGSLASCIVQVLNQSQGSN